MLGGGYGGTDTLYVFDVNEAQTLSYAGHVTLESEFYGVACTRRDNDTLVAFSHVDTCQLCLCNGSRHSHCVSSHSRASTSPIHIASCSAETCCSSQTTTVQPERTRSCLSAFLATRSLSDECSSTLRTVFMHTAVLSPAIVIATSTSSSRHRNEFLIYEFTSNGE